MKQLDKIVDAFIKNYFTDDDQNTTPYEERMMTLDRNDLIAFAKYVLRETKKKTNTKPHVFPWFH